MKPFILLTFLLLALTAGSGGALAADCTFEILVQTGTVQDAGTDARVSLQVNSAEGGTLDIKNLESWGQMSAGHDYFEGGNLDRFRGTGKCMATEPCKLLLISDGTGYKPGWYVKYVMVSQLGQGSVLERKFVVDQWLAIDEAPYKLFAFRDGCDHADA